MKVSKKNLMLAGMTFSEEIKKFAHAFSAWDKARNRKDAFEAGKVTFKITEMEDPATELKEKYISSVHGACRALYVLDRKFYIKEHLHIVGRLENLADMENALEEIDNFLTA